MPFIFNNAPDHLNNEVKKKSWKGQIFQGLSFLPLVMIYA